MRAISFPHLDALTHAFAKRHLPEPPPGSVRHGGTQEADGTAGQRAPDGHRSPRLSKARRPGPPVSHAIDDQPRTSAGHTRQLLHRHLGDGVQINPRSARSRLPATISRGASRSAAQRAVIRAFRTVGKSRLRPSRQAAKPYVYTSPPTALGPARAPQASTRRGRANRYLLRIQRLRREGRRSSTPTRFREHRPWSLGGHEHRRPLPRSTGCLFLSSPGLSRQWCFRRDRPEALRPGPERARRCSRFSSERRPGRGCCRRLGRCPSCRTRRRPTGWTRSCSQRRGRGQRCRCR
jgi:hypothetical protein